MKKIRLLSILLALVMLVAVCMPNRITAEETGEGEPTVVSMEEPVPETEPEPQPEPEPESQPEPEPEPEPQPEPEPEPEPQPEPEPESQPEPEPESQPEPELEPQPEPEPEPEPQPETELEPQPEPESQLQPGNQPEFVSTQSEVTEQVVQTEETASQEEKPESNDTEFMVSVADIKSIALGKDVNFKAVITGASYTGASYQWERSDDKGKTFTPITGAKARIYTYTVPASAVNFNYDTFRVRCKVTIGGKEVVSEAAGVTRPFTATFPAPSPAKAVIGTSMTMTVTTKNTKGDLTYLWQYSKDNGKTWSQLLAAGTSRVKQTAVFSVSEEHFDAWYRCLVTDSQLGTVHSTIRTKIPRLFTVDVTPKPTVKTGIDKEVKLTAVTTGANSTPSYQWYYSKDGGNNWYKSKEKNNNLRIITITVTEAYLNDYLFRCEATTRDGVINSNCVKISKAHNPTVQVDSSYAAIGEQVTFSAVPNNAAAYQWYVRKENWEKVDVNGESKDLVVTVDAATYDYRYRCLVTVAGNAVYTENKLIRRPFTVTAGVLLESGEVTKGVIKAGIGEKIAFGATHTKAGGIVDETKTIWQISTNGKDWDNLGDNKYTVKEADYGKTSVRCLLTVDGQQVNSAAVTIQRPFTVAATISTKPGLNQWAKYAATVEDADTQGAVYQWERSDDKGKTFKTISGAAAKNAEYSYRIPADGAGFSYDTFMVRCKVTIGGQMVYSNILGVERPFAVTTSANRVREVGTSASFAVTVSENVKYQWQYSLNGGTSWWDISKKADGEGFNTKLLQLTVDRTVYIRQYRCKVTLGNVSTIGSTVYVEATNYGCFTWKTNASGWWVVAGHKTSDKATDIVIPSGHEGKKVMAIGSNAFKGQTSITSVTIPYLIDEIGASAFEGCTGLRTVKLPDRVKKIGECAFKNCTVLSSMTIQN